MIERAILFVVSGSEEHDSVYIGDGEYRNMFDLVVEGAENVDRFMVCDSDRDTRTVWVRPDTVHAAGGYPQNAIGDFTDIAPLVEYGIVFELLESSESAWAYIYAPTQERIPWTEQAQLEGSEKARGYDLADEIRDRFGIDFGWKWKDFTTVYPVVDEI